MRRALTRILALAILFCAATTAHAQSTLSYQQRRMPKVTGMTETVARELLKRYGIQFVDVTYTNLPVGAVGTVVVQKPGEQTPITAGMRVALIVIQQKQQPDTLKTTTTLPPAGVAPREIRVPNLIGMTVEQAQARLAAVRLRPGVISSRPDEATPGTVYLQYPAAGHPALAGSSVSILFATPIIPQTPARVDTVVTPVAPPVVASPSPAPPTTTPLQPPPQSTPTQPQRPPIVPVSPPAVSLPVAPPPEERTSRVPTWLWILAAIVALVIVGKLARDVMKVNPQIPKEALELLNAKAASTALPRAHLTQPPASHTTIRYVTQGGVTRTSLVPHGDFIIKEERSNV